MDDDALNGNKFIARLKLPEHQPPVKAYLHCSGLFLFGGRVDCLSTFVNNAQRYLLDSLSETKRHYDDCSFLLATIWGDETRREKVIDLFGYHGLTNWRSNPEVSSWTIRNGVVTRETDITCEDTLIVLGFEAVLRRETGSLADYMSRNPSLGIKNPLRLDNLEERTL